MFEKLGIGVISIMALMLLGTSLYSSMLVSGQGGNATSNQTTSGRMVGATYGGVDIDSSKRHY